MRFNNLPTKKLWLARYLSYVWVQMGQKHFNSDKLVNLLGHTEKSLSAKLTNHSTCTMSRPVIENKGHFMSLPFSFIYSFHFYLIKGSLTLVQPHNKPGFLLRGNGSTHQIQLKFCSVIQYLLWV